MIEELFRAALQDAGFCTNDAIIADGMIHRFYIKGDKKSSVNGWYVLFDDEIPAGCYGSWKTGDKFLWCIKDLNELSPKQRSHHTKRMEEARKLRELEQAKRQKVAKSKAHHIWDKTKEEDVQAFLYLKSKGVQNHGLRLYKEALVVPMSDENGVLHSLQFITEKGQKRFLAGGKKQGCFYLIGEPKKRLCIAEGYATAASIHQVTGHACAVAFDAGNLLHVAKALRAKFPDIEIILCADNDTKTEEAATAIEGLLAVPPSHGDFNDLYQQNNGAEIIREIVENTQPPVETPRVIVKRLANLHPLEYERIRKDEANKLGIDRITILDKEVEKARAWKSNKNCDTKFPVDEPWEEPVDMAEVLDEITALIKRFIICAPETTHAAALWIAFTWILDYVHVSPIAFITAPEMGCGKSQLLTVIGKMVKKPAIASNMSSAVIYRVIEKYCPTLLIDEADSFVKGNEELRNIINSGHTRQSAYVWRCEGDDFEPTQFSTWSAKALCGIGTQAATIMDRSIILELRRKLSHEKIERLRHAETTVFKTIRRKLSRFAQDAGKIISKARPELPDALSDRAQDNWEHLLAIADYAGGHWPVTARETALLIYAKSKNEDNQSPGIMLLHDIQDIFDSEPTRSRIKSADLLQKLCAIEERPWGEWNKGKPITASQIARYLKPYGVTPKSIRTGYEVAKGYLKADFEDSFTRYLSDQNVTPLQTALGNDYSDNSNRNTGQNVTDSISSNPAENNDCNGVTDVEVF